jgi:hypothetical protein
VPDLDDLQRAVRETAERATPPAFETLVGRARARRRRRAASGVAAVAVVLAGGGVAALLPHDADTSVPPVVQRPSASPVPSPAPTVQQVVAAGRLYSYGSGGSGAVMTVWQACAHGSLHCRYAWRLTDRSGTVAQGPAGTGDGSSGPEVRAGGGGYVLKRWDRPGFAVRDDGTVLPLAPGHVDPVDASAVAVRAGGRRMELVDPRTGATQLVPDVPGSDALADAVVAPDGTVWAMPAFAGPGKVEVAWLRDGQWRTHPVDDPQGSRAAVPGILAVTGTRTAPAHVAALASYDGATSLPVGVLAVSADGGTSWTHLTRKDVPFGAVDSMAATAGGTLFVADPAGALWRSADGAWTSFTRVTGVGPVYGLEPAGEQVLARTATKEPGVVLLGDGGGAEQVAVR